MSIHNCSGIFLKYKSQALVEVLANSRVRLDGVWDDGVGGMVMETCPFGERYYGQNVIVPLDDVVVFLVGKFREAGRGKSFDLAGGDLSGEGIVGNIGSGGSVGLEGGYC